MLLPSQMGLLCKAQVMLDSTDTGLKADLLTFTALDG